MLPFLRHYFPEAKIVPVAMSVKARRADWDKLAEALKTLVDDDTLIVRVRPTFRTICRSMRRDASTSRR